MSGERNKPDATAAAKLQSPLQQNRQPTRRRLLAIQVTSLFAGTSPIIESAKTSRHYFASEIDSIMPIASTPGAASAQLQPRDNI